MIWIQSVEDEIEEADEVAKESHKFAMNSYGAGYDRGYLEGLKKALVLTTEVVPAAERGEALNAVSDYTDVEVEEG